MSSAKEKALALLEGAEKKLEKTRALIGLDGYVDSITRVVDKRHSPEKFDAYQTISDLAERIKRAAGKSTNLELVCEKQKLGGNGPIMANALGAYGVRVRYIGNLGHPKVHHVFAAMSAKCEVISIAEPCHTEALEFDDGKLMLTKSEQLKEVSWKNLVKKIGSEKLLKYFKEAGFIALNNWSQTPYMTEIWQQIQSSIAPKLAGDRRTIFFDLADPEKRVAEDMKKGLITISGFEKHFRTILGLNESEAYQVAKSLGVPHGERGGSSLAQLAMDIRQKLKISIVVVHPREFACAADEHGDTFVEGPFCAKPLISTGAGDHFNAGFCLGMILGDDLAAALQIGVATSGYYVRTGQSPSLANIRKFLKEI